MQGRYPGSPARRKGTVVERLPRSLIGPPVRAALAVGIGAQRPRVADRADLGEVALERQADRPVEHSADLPGGARDLAHVVAAGHPPRREAAELAVPEPADRLVAAQVHERRLAPVGEAARLADAE